MVNKGRKKNPMTLEMPLKMKSHSPDIFIKHHHQNNDKKTLFLYSINISNETSQPHRFSFWPKNATGLESYKLQRRKKNE